MTELIADADAAGALAEQRYLAGIATERRDVVADPGQGRLLIEQSEVAGRAPADCSRSAAWLKKPSGLEAVVQRHYHDALGSARGPSFIGRRAATAPTKPPPWTKTMTGSGSVTRSGLQTLSVRQSSDEAGST